MKASGRTCSQNRKLTILPMSQSYNKINNTPVNSFLTNSILKLRRVKKSKNVRNTMFRTTLKKRQNGLKRLGKAKPSIKTKTIDVLNTLEKLAEA